MHSSDTVLKRVMRCRRKGQGPQQSSITKVDDGFELQVALPCSREAQALCELRPISPFGTSLPMPHLYELVVIGGIDPFH